MPGTVLLIAGIIINDQEEILNNNLMKSPSDRKMLSIMNANESIKTVLQGPPKSGR